MIIIGCGDLSRKLISHFDFFKKNVVFFDQFFSSKSFYGYDVINDIEHLVSSYANEKFVCCISNNSVRERLVTNFEKNGFKLDVLIHPSCLVDTSSIISPGVILFPNVVVEYESIIGKAAIVDYGSVLDHGALIDPYDYLYPLTYIRKD